MLAAIKRWLKRRRLEIAAHQALRDHLDTLIDYDFINRIGK